MDIYGILHISKLNALNFFQIILVRIELEYLIVKRFQNKSMYTGLHII